MALTDESVGGNGFYMPVAPAYGNNGGWGLGGFGGDGWAWILLLLLIGGNGWGFGGFGGGWGMMGMDGFGLYPWLNNSQNINSGFRDQTLNANIVGISDKITSGFGDVATQLCGGFAGVTASVNNAQNAIAQQLYANEIASLQQSFNTQSSLQNCCCENRAGLADVKYTIATENCADRAALSDGIRDLLAATQAQTQTILTQLCNDKIEQKNDLINQLRQELLYARGQASQDVQTATLRAGQVAEVDALYDRLSQCPVNTIPVYGNQPVFACNNTCGCGCNG